MKIALERHFGGSRDAMAAALGITPQSVWNYVSGGKDPDAKIARRLESAVGRSFTVIEAPHRLAIMISGTWYEPGTPGYDLLASVVNALLPFLAALAAGVEARASRPEIARRRKGAPETVIRGV
jgi:transcriptional regulator with XRE-family HTH domain